MLLLFLFFLLCRGEVYSIPSLANVSEFARIHNLRYLKNVAGFDIFSGTTRKRDVGLIVDQKRKQSKRYYRNAVTDPLYNTQWHLHLSRGVAQSLDGSPTGKGVTVAIVDDGLQWRHPDLSGNYRSDLSHNFNSGPSNDPTPARDDGHGTSASGSCCAARNTICGRGVAYQASLVGIRLISESVYDYQEAEGLSFNVDKIRIYSCSWGPADDGRDMIGPGPVTRESLRRSYEKYGTVYIWAGGNGRSNDDSANYDGYANSPYTLAIGAIDYNGNQAYYSESGANLLAVAPSSGALGHGIVTTDLMGSYGYDQGECTFSFGGTSAAAPIAAGVVALLLEIRPELTSRDIMHIVAKGATKVRTATDYSTVNPRGYSHSNAFGFGLMRIPPLVALARNFTRVPPMQRVIVGSGTTALSFVERALVTVTIVGIRGSLTLKLISPETTSLLMSPHNDVHSGPFTWTFSSLRHFGEEYRKGDIWTVSDEPRGMVRDIKIELLGY
jgi:subtilisin family serine protease